MELRLTNGDYVPDGFGGFCRETDRRGLLAKALFLLTAKRGSFPLLPNLGSRLYLIGQEPPSAREMVALQYANEALADTEISALDAQVRVTDEQTASLTLVLQIGSELQTVEVNI